MNEQLSASNVPAAPKPLLAVASLGGTITMMPTDADGQRVRPSLDVAQLLEAVPTLADAAELHTTTLQTVPSASLTFADVLRALAWAREQVADVAGAIVIQGTDNIEETSYLLDLYWDRPEPVVVTGAMRAPRTPGADGPANLLASVRVAGEGASRNRGVLVVLNDEIHAARWVRKMRASGTDAFASPTFGPLGYVDEHLVVYGSAAGNRRTLRLPEPFTTPQVALLETFLGDDGAMLESLANEVFDGVVMAGFGVGHVSAAVAAAVEKTAAAMPVVLATRTGAGSTHRNSYGFDGSESDLIAKGVIPAGSLDPRKARILLASLLACGAERSEIQAEFNIRGRALHNS